MARVTRTQIPILIGDNYRHVMSSAVILEQENTVSLTLTVEGFEADNLLALLASGEPQALQFVPIPVNPRKT